MQQDRRRWQRMHQQVAQMPALEVSRDNSQQTSDNSQQTSETVWDGAPRQAHQHTNNAAALRASTRIDSGASPCEIDST